MVRSSEKELRIKNYLNVLEILSQSTDDFLFLFDIEKDENIFFGNVDCAYAVRKEGSHINSTAQMLEIVYPNDREALKKDLIEVTNGTKEFHNMDYRWVNRDGQVVWINCRGKVIKDENGKPFVMIGRVSEEAMRHLFNPLTGLFNETKMMMDLKENFSKESHGFFMIIDIDDLFAINLSHGRKYGDDVLISLAETLENIPLVEQVYHIEHNYFAVCLDVSGENEVRKIFAEIQDKMFEKCSLTAGAIPKSNLLFIEENNMFDSAKLTLRKAKSKGKNKK